MDSVVPHDRPSHQRNRYQFRLYRRDTACALPSQNPKLDQFGLLIMTL
jgi:hypothetical protein